jgi:hypothetical protein
MQGTAHLALAQICRAVGAAVRLSSLVVWPHVQCTTLPSSPVGVDLQPALNEPGT